MCIIYGYIIYSIYYVFNVIRHILCSIYYMVYVTSNYIYTHICIVVYIVKQTCVSSTKHVLPHVSFYQKKRVFRQQNHVIFYGVFLILQKYAKSKMCYF